MNRRNFVVGLGTVATLSGVASVTAASFASSTQASTNFSIVALEGNLVLRRLDSTLPGGSDPSNYSELADQTDAWNETQITDFGNVTRESNQNNSVVAYVNEQTNSNLEADLAFEARNTTYTEYTGSGDGYGFFELANLGETEESVSMTFGYNSTNVAENDTAVDTSTGGTPLNEEDVAEIFTFTADGQDISPESTSPNRPGDSVSLDPGQVVTVELTISMTDTQASNVQDVAGSSPFGGGLDEYSFQLIDNVTVGSDFN